MLDENSEMQDRFRLIRIKDKLDTSSNNVMINYMIGGVPC